MTYLGTRIRLYAAQVNANAMGLERTAGRLKVLRKQLSNHKRLTDPERKENLRWALAKLEDTKKNVRSEAKELGAKGEVYDNMADSCLTNRILKFVGTVISLTIMSSYIREILTQVSSHLRVFGVIATTAGLVALSFHMVDMLFSRDLDEGVCRAKLTIDKCHKTLSNGLAEFEEVPMRKEKE